MGHASDPDPRPFTVRQRIVGFGAVSGWLGGVGLSAALWDLLPVPEGVVAAGDRLAFAIRCCALPALTFAVGIGAVGNRRAMGEGIDPTAAHDDRRLVIHGRYTDNTGQQLLLLVLAMLGLSLHLDPDDLGLLPALATTFVLGRLAFWAGYLRDPLLRAPGMGMTFSTTMLPTIYLAVVTALALPR